MKIRFFLRNKSRYQDYIPLICRITHHGISEFDSGLLIREQHWSQKEQIDLRDKINIKLDLIRERIIDIYNEHADSSWTSHDILNQLDMDQAKRDPEEHMNWAKLFAAHDQHQKLVKGSGKYTRDRYQRCIKYFQEDLTGIQVQDIKRAHISLFYQALRKRGIANNMAVKYISLLSSVIDYGNYLDLIDIKNPCKGQQFKLEEIETVYLDHDELSRLETKDLSKTPRLERIRDIFVFQCYTGMEYSRVRELNVNQITIDMHRNKWVQSRRIKTDTATDVFLYPEALKILEKYSWYQDDHDGVAFPVISNQRMNGYLQEIAEICHISKHLTTHKARHTFATTVLLDRGMSMESVKNQLGHKSIKTTESIYGKITKNRIRDESVKVLKEHYS